MISKGIEKTVTKVTKVTRADYQRVTSNLRCNDHRKSHKSYKSYRKVTCGNPLAIGV